MSGDRQRKRRRQRSQACTGEGAVSGGIPPTVNQLEQRAAEIAGKEAALFVPTGTMGNTMP